MWRVGDVLHVRDKIDNFLEENMEAIDFFLLTLTGAADLVL